MNTRMLSTIEVKIEMRQTVEDKKGKRRAEQNGLIIRPVFQEMPSSIPEKAAKGLQITHRTW